MRKNYPNLELLEYKSIMYMMGLDKGNLKEYSIHDFKMKRRPIFDATVFLQLWASTCLGFDVDDEGNAYCGGSAMTEAYTTVMHETTSDTYFVFFDGDLCYVVTEPTEKFLNDLKNHRLESRSEAKVKY